MNDNGIQVKTFASENYDRNDWLLVLEPFEEHDKLQRDNEEFTLEEILTHPDSNKGTTGTYLVKDTGARFNLRLSPHLRSEENVMLEGSLDYHGDLEGDILEETRRNITEEHADGYLEPVDAEYALATLTINEDYDTSQIEDTVEAAVDIGEDVEQLEDQLRDTIHSYEGSH